MGDLGGSAGPTGCGACHQASTGVTTKLLTGIHSVGRVATTSTVAGSSPTSSSASRSAQAIGSASPGSAAPPGNAGCPAWLRMVAARCSTSMSGPAGRLLAEQDQDRALPRPRRPASAGA